MYAVNEVRVITPSVREFIADPKCRAPGDILGIWRDTVTGAKQYDPEKEQFVVFALNAQNRVKSWEIVSMGIMDASLIHPRETYRAAIVQGAAAIIVAHNHPSGSTTPSAEDLAVTQRLVEAGRIIGIPCLDHVIIGQPMGDEPGWLSLRESGMVIF